LLAVYRAAVTLVTCAHSEYKCIYRYIRTV